MKNLPVLLILIILLASGCRRDTQPVAQTKIAVTNSYFECAVRDLCDDIPVVCLTPPGMCPGHFDLLPSSAQQLRQCRLLLRFEFQRGMDQQMLRFVENGLQIKEIVSAPGMCIPATYAAVCDQIGQALSICFPEKRDSLQRRILEIKQRMTKLEEKLRIDGAESINVICSTHQAEFAKSLGFHVVSIFLGSDMATPANMGQCLTAAENKQIQFVIANKQEGTDLAGVLADRLHARPVVFTNFPDTGIETMDFDKMVIENISQLQKNGAM
jgi:ABC-type Zn uptake system ZnuABC Zn-binding protein ZnuA